MPKEGDQPAGGGRAGECRAIPVASANEGKVSLQLYRSEGAIGPFSRKKALMWRGCLTAEVRFLRPAAISRPVKFC